ncbi:GumC family protein [Fluviicola chungangensis]|uniref:non-specific protein-tyrosine kinase n=1 Tax=Fluviicola chungangensis TaxID=2597671 RepID=A0A556N135_9FLAO|nr:polysaccharide biosynthesis tyrosine autokinase [Fluviicola chungangensis]TSJ45795.1 polysaccharide biosynthesis tyrosine autokinase [Fluviicola chungangensis]
MRQEEAIYKVRENEESAISLRDLLDKYLIHWRWVLSSVILLLVLGWVYARYQTPSYESTATVLIEQESKSGMASEELGMLKDLGLASGGGVLEDEIELYQSRSLMEHVVRELQLHWKYQIVGTTTGLVRSELYDSNPIRVRSVEADSLYYDKHYEFEITLTSANEYTITSGNELVGNMYKYGAVLQLSIGNIILEKTNEFKSPWIGKRILINVSPVSEVATEIRKNLSVEPASKDANILVLKVKGHNVGKNNAILNKIIAVHQENAINNKNEVVKNTTAFINDRMKFIAAELTDVEKKGEDYKSKHHLVDVTTDAVSYLEKEGDIEKKVVDASIEMELADFMNEVVSQQNGYEQLLPANLGFKDPSIGEMTNQYNTLVLERNRLRETNGGKHPKVASIESQLSSLRTSLENSLRNMRNSSKMELKKLKSEEQLYQSKISSIPQFEREYRDIFRQQQIKESLYLFLLQKREQNEISLAATVANSRVIDEAYSTGIPVSPKKTLIYLIALMFGILIPIGVIYLRTLLNNKIVSRTDLDHSGLTVVGDIPEVKDKDKLLAWNYPQSNIAESFRVLRTNLSFVIPSGKDECRVIGITSSLSGEGKSSTSVNLAFMFAATGKKVLLMGLDLRKPRIKEILELKNMPGLSNYLVNQDLKAKDIISVAESNGHSFNVIQAGDIPPNPSELLMSHRLDELMGDLRKEFDYIILDNAPVGLVIDAVTTNRLTDISLYIIRSGMINKRYQNHILELKNQGKLKNLYIMMNAVKNKVGSYSYSYSYGYGEDVEKRPWWKRLLGIGQ